MWPRVSFNLSQPLRDMESAHRENDPSPSFERPDPRVVREFGLRRRRPSVYFTGWERNDRPRRSRECTAKRPGLGRSDQARVLTEDLAGL